MNILVSYFSATGNTAAITDVIIEKFKEMDAEVDRLDVTSLHERSRAFTLEPYDAVLFGAPIHSWRAPRVFRNWISTLHGEGRKCAMFFTYGGFGVHPCHYSTRRILEDRKFQVVSSADFLGAHTFNLGGWRAMLNRPDESDFDVAREYAYKTFRRFTGEDQGVPVEFEKTDHTEAFLDSVEVNRFRVLTKLPSRLGAGCSMCLLCEKDCPTGAMDAEAGSAEKGKCIACLRCFYRCPERALKINDMSSSWDLKLKMEKISEEELRRKTSRFYL